MDLDHYRHKRIIPHDDKAYKVSNTVEFSHQSITNPSKTLEDRIIHGLNTLTGTLTDAPTDKYDSQFQGFTDLRDACASWESLGDTLDPDAPTPLASTVQPHCKR